MANPILCPIYTSVRTLNEASLNNTRGFSKAVLDFDVDGSKQNSTIQQLQTKLTGQNFHCARAAK